MENIEDKVEDQDMVNVNKLNEDYNEYPPKQEEYPKLYFIDIEKYGVVIDNE